MGAKLKWTSDAQEEDDNYNNNKVQKLSVCGKFQKKVCMICLCESDHIVEFRLYVVDLNTTVTSSRFVYRPPTLRLSCESYLCDGFCVVGSTLFVFEGCDLGEPAAPISKSVYSFDLSSVSETGDIRLKKSKLKHVGEMFEGKRYAKAVPTPDGSKILVFSTTLNHTAIPYDFNRLLRTRPGYFPGREPRIEDGVADKVVDFELYDPATNVFIKLPRICHNLSDEVLGYAFDRGSRFYLRTQVGLFSIDLVAADTRWDHTPPCVPVVPLGRSFFIDKDVCLSSKACFDIENECEGYDPCFSPLPHSLRLEDYHFTLLGVGDDRKDNGGYGFCVSQPCLDKRDTPHMVIDVCSLDVARYRDGDKRGFPVKKTLKFVVGKRPLYSFSGISLFSM